MEWRVIKLGAQMFDALHAYGLGVVVASSTNEQVVVQDGGCFYRLSCSSGAVPPVPIDLLDEIFLLPEPGEVLRVQQVQPARHGVPLGVANLDGLLAALFTRPDVVRSCSLSALLRKHDFDPNVCPHQPLPGVTRQESDITATMVLDPSFAYASRQTLSDGRVGRKVNMTIRGTRFATLLAYIGAIESGTREAPAVSE